MNFCLKAHTVDKIEDTREPYMSPPFDNVFEQLKVWVESVGHDAKASFLPFLRFFLSVMGPQIT